MKNLLTILVETWNKYAKVYDALMQAPIFKDLCKRWIDSIPFCPGGLIHDAGCGTGVFLERILEKTGAKKIVATDISPEMLKRARKKVIKMSPDKQKRIELVQFDLTKGWPDRDFNVQLFQLVFNYIPLRDGGWKGLLSKAVKSTVPGGIILSSIILGDRPSIRELGKKYTVREAFKTPIWAWPAMFKSSRILSVFDKLREERVVEFPTEEEFLEFHRKLGLEVEIIGPIFWGAGITVKAKVPVEARKKRKDAKKIAIPT